jgi:hypothetical protein
MWITIVIQSAIGCGETLISQHSLVVCIIKKNSSIFKTFLLFHRRLHVFKN